MIRDPFVIIKKQFLFKETALAMNFLCLILKKRQ